MTEEYPSILNSLISLKQSTEFIEQLSFNQTKSLSKSSLISDILFETVALRDSNLNEVDLFSTSISTSSILLPRNTTLGESDGGVEMISIKRNPLQRRLVSATIPSSTTPASSTTGSSSTESTSEQTEVIQILSKVEDFLLQFPMKRYSIHVEELLFKVNNLIQSINSLQINLTQRLPRQPDPVTATILGTDTVSSLTTQNVLTAAMKSDQLEIVALTEMTVERQREIDQLKATLLKSKPKPVPRKRIIPTGATLNTATPEEEEDPFGKAKSNTTLAERKATATSSSRSIPTPVVTPVKASPRKSITSPPTSVPRITSTPSLRRSIPASSLSPSNAPNASPGNQTLTPRQQIVVPISPLRPSTIKVPTPRKVSSHTRPVGIEESDLEEMADKIWNGTDMQSTLNPWARKMLLETAMTRGEGNEVVPRKVKALNFIETSRLLNLILSAPPSTSSSSDPTPSITSSSYPSLAHTSSDDESDLAMGGPPIELALPSPTPATLMDLKLLSLFLSASSTRPILPLSSTTTSTAPPDKNVDLVLTIREIISPTTFQSTKKLEGLVTLAAMKSQLSAFAVSRGYDTGAAMTAVYSMVSKRVVRIERRGGAMVGWRI